MNVSKYVGYYSLRMISRWYLESSNFIVSVARIVDAYNAPLFRYFLTTLLTGSVKLLIVVVWSEI